jgi:arsenite methyltransferase
MMGTVTETRDQWHRWLLEVRHGGDAEFREQMLANSLHPVRDRVLERADLQPDDTLLDVGCGDGLIAFGALDRLGPAGRVIFSDVSLDLLDHCRVAAEVSGQLDRCEFVQATADRLEGIADASVDVVTTRSVLIYVKDKAAAFSEFRRVLRPGGRISLFEPINVLMNVREPDTFVGYDVSAIAPTMAKVMAVLRTYQPDLDPMTDFDERDLVRLAEEAGFGVVDLELRVTVKSSRPPASWDRLLRMSGNPLVPPLADVLDQALTEQEKAEFTAHLRPLVEAGTGQDRTAVAFLKASGGEPAPA